MRRQGIAVAPSPTNRRDRQISETQAKSPSHHPMALTKTQVLEASSPTQNYAIWRRDKKRWKSRGIGTRWATSMTMMMQLRLMVVEMCHIIKWETRRAPASWTIHKSLKMRRNRIIWSDRERPAKRGAKPKSKAKRKRLSTSKISMTQLIRTGMRCEQRKNRQSQIRISNNQSQD